MGANGTTAAVAPERISEQLQRLLSSQTFARSNRLKRFLQFTLERLDNQQQDQLKEYSLGIEVFDRKPSFDPRSDSIVRVEANRLRMKLKQYYETEGSGDAVIVEFPKGSYVPVIRPKEAAKPSGGLRRLGLVLAGVAALLGAVVMVTLHPKPAVAPAELVQLTSDSGLTAYPSLSPDGKLLGYASDRGGEGNLSIWVQPVAGGEPTRLTRHKANDRDPSFSPDGTKIAFRSELDGGGIYVVPVFGGEPRRIAGEGRRPRFSPDGAWILYWVRDATWAPGKIYVVPSAGGTPRQLRPEFDDAHNPIWAPDGKHILFCGTRRTNFPAEEHDWWVTPFPSGSPSKTGTIETFARLKGAPRQGSFSGASGDVLGTPAAWAGDQVVFSARNGDSEDLWRVRIDAGKWSVRSVPQRLTFGTAVDAQPSVAAGRVAFVSATLSVGIWALPLAGNEGKAAGEPKKLTLGVYQSHPSISADGRKLAFISERKGNRDVWLKELDTNRETALTATPASTSEGHPNISPDGTKVVYRVIENPWQVLYLVSSGGGPAERICADCGLPTGWSQDGRYILFEPGSTVPAVGLLEVGTRTLYQAAADSRVGLHSARFSPDDRWIAFHSQETQHTGRIYVAPFRAGQRTAKRDWIPVTGSSETSHNPCWSPGGELLYFLSERDQFRCIWAQRLDARTKRPQGPPFAVQHFHAAGNSLLMNVRANPNQVGLWVAGGRLVFALDELAANIWMARF